MNSKTGKWLNTYGDIALGKPKPGSTNVMSYLAAIKRDQEQDGKRQSAVAQIELPPLPTPPPIILD